MYSRCIVYNDLIVLALAINYSQLQLISNSISLVITPYLANIPLLGTGNT